MPDASPPPGQLALPSAGLHVERHGDIKSPLPPVLLVHGLGGSTAHWDAVVDDLAKGRLVVCVDLPGFGASRAVRSRLSLDEHAQHLLNLLDRELPGRRVHLAGHSAGGPFAVRLAALAAPRVASVALVAGALVSALRLGRRNQCLAVLRQQPGVAAALVRELLTVVLPVPAPVARAVERSPRLRQLALAPFVHDTSRLTGEDVQMLVSGAGAPGALGLVRALLGVDLLAELTALQAPLLALTGDQDRLVPAADLDQVRAIVRSAVVTAIAGSGHLPMLEAPEHVVDALRTFWHQHDRPTTPTGSMR